MSSNTNMATHEIAMTADAVKHAKHTTAPATPKKALAALNAAAVATAVGRHRVAAADVAVKETVAIMTVLRAAQVTVYNAREALKRTGLSVTVEEYLFNIAETINESIELAGSVQKIASDDNVYERSELDAKAKEEAALVLPCFSRIEIEKLVVFVDDIQHDPSKKRKHDVAQAVAF
jgi:hypothetical protein